MTKKYIQLPKSYLSYSQYSLWKSDKQKYADHYFDNRTELATTNYGQQYGKMVADALEKAEETGDLLTDSALLLLPKYDVRDQEFFVDVKTKDGWLKLIMKPDFLNSETKEFIEVKTGVHPWTQRRAGEHIQLPFYAVGIWQKYDVLLKNAILAWVETERQTDPAGLVITKPTGRVDTFTVFFSPGELLDLLADMVEVAKEIEIAWASHVTNPELVNF